MLKNDKLLSIASSNQTASPFLRLPAEIRNFIYELTLNGYIHVYTDFGAPIFWKQQAKFYLLHTCRQIRYEATPVFYGACTFDFHEPFEADILTYRLGKQLTGSITSVKLSVGGAVSLRKPAYQSSFWEGVLPALKEVRVESWNDKWAKQMLEEVKLEVGGREVRMIFEYECPSEARPEILDFP